ncbi:hypothetical protein GBAR_LOCUS5612 [Geodia barretti]|uniref:Uncharacterized protein n=1 Tax=Geodia barretti TaxID=519541 RepID=A0AA35RBF8_GEOBA|nr:hypothetical protein GBAR_LOCUS5612 [Geodia barretti]
MFFISEGFSDCQRGNEQLRVVVAKKVTGTLPAAENKRTQERGSLYMPDAPIHATYTTEVTLQDCLNGD